MPWLLFLAVLLLSGCSNRNSADPGIVTIAMDQNPDNLDPRIGQNAASQRLDALIFNSLVRKNENFEVVPDLALRWEIPDPTTYIFHLRTDVRFHDGRPLTSKDVQFTFQSMLNGSVHTTRGHPYNLIASIDTPDPSTVIFKLKEAFAPFLWSLTPDIAGVIPAGSSADFNHSLIGSGPFEFVHYLQDQEVVLKRNDSYFGNKPGVAMLRFKVIPEEIVVALELRKGSVDIAPNVLAPDMVEVLKREKTLSVQQTNGTNYQYIAFNFANPVFSDVRVRQAIAYGIDRDSIIKYLWRSQARAAVGVLPPNNWAYNGDVKTYPYDPAKARELLREAGQEHFHFTFSMNNDNATTSQMTAIFQQQLKDIGVTMDIHGNEFATFFADVIKGNFQAYSLRWIGANNDPDIFNLIFHSKSFPPRGSNRGHYSNPRVDELIEFARREVDMDKRKQAYAEVQRIVSEELPYISLFYMDNVAVYNKRIDGLHLAPSADYGFLQNIRITPVD